MRKTYLYQAKINKATEANCFQWLYLCRTLYNLALDQRISIYRQHKMAISANQQMKQLTELKESFAEFKAVGSQCLQDVIQRLDKAYQAFFQRVKQGNGKAGFPRFRGQDRYDSFTLKQAGWQIEGRYLNIKNIGRFKLFLSRPIEGDIKTVTIRKSSTGKWFVAFSCDNVPEREFAGTDAEVGIDVGIKSFCVDSDGKSVANPQYFRKAERELTRRQRSLSRKKRGSKRRQKARLLVAKSHKKVTNQRKDFLHKTANHYIKKYQSIAIEDLNIKGMVKNRHLAKSISDSSWGMFFNLLAYKAEEAGRQVVKVTPNGTSQICSGCGEKVPKSLAVRVHSCPFCNLVLDRDLNASLNIKALGQRVQALTDGLLSVA
jgi:putative transposase